MKAVRVFARFQHAIDPRTEIPPFGLLPYRPPRLQPYLYTDDEIRRLLETTSRLSSRRGIRPHSYYCLLGLLAVSGMRISEALGLQEQDVDLQSGILTIRQSKFRKSRMVPLHPSTVDALRNSDSFLVSDLGRVPSQLTWEDFDAPLIGAFLDHCEKERHNVVRTRNLRLAAIRSFFRYVSFQEPAEAARIQQILLIPNKRQPRRLIGFLTYPEVEALLAAPDQRSWSGRRDHTFLLLTVQTGLRLSEVTGLRRQDVILGNLASLLQDTNRLGEAEPLMRRHLEIFLKFTRSTGHPHPHLQAAFNNYAGLLDAQGRSREQILATLRDLAPEFS